MKKLLLGVMLFSSLIVNNSCDSSEIVENKTIKSSNSKQIKKLMKSAFLIQKELKSNDKLLSRIRNNAKINGRSVQYIDQETLDYIKDIGGISDVDINLEQVNLIIAENLEAREIGYGDYIDNMNYSETTKSYLQSFINETEPIEDLTSQPEFLSLTSNDQNMLINVNETMDIYNNQIAQTYRIEFMSEGFCVGSSVGNAVGNVLCGPPCGIAGWIIGGILGDALK